MKTFHAVTKKLLQTPSTFITTLVLFSIPLFAEQLLQRSTVDISWNFYYDLFLHRHHTLAPLACLHCFYTELQDSSHWTMAQRMKNQWKGMTAKGNIMFQIYTCSEISHSIILLAYLDWEGCHNSLGQLQ